MKPRSPAVAFLLGLVAPGLGHLYAGRPGRGLVALVILCAVLIPLAVELTLLVWVSPAAILSGLLLTLIPFIMVAADGAIAVRKPGGLPPGPLNRWFVYAAWVVLSILILPAGLRLVMPFLPIRVFMVPTGSMTPTILAGDWVIGRMGAPGVADLVRGEIPLFEPPDRPGLIYLDRLVALPGESVEIRSKQLLVNGRPVDEPYKVHSSDADRELWSEVLEGQSMGAAELRAVTRRGGPDPFPIAPVPFDWGPVEVPGDAVILLGDNRDNARDSRSVGPVPLDSLQGRALRIFWSWDLEMGRIRWERIGAPLK